MQYSLESYPKAPNLCRGCVLFNPISWVYIPVGRYYFFWFKNESMLHRFSCMFISNISWTLLQLSIYKTISSFFNSCKIFCNMDMHNLSNSSITNGYKICFQIFATINNTIKDFLTQKFICSHVGVCLNAWQKQEEHTLSPK